MKRLLLLCLLVATTARASTTASFDDLVAVTGTFSGQVTSNGSNILTSTSRDISFFHWLRGVSNANPVIIAEFTTGGASTLTDFYYQTYLNSAATTGTLTLAVATTGGVNLCTATYNCNTTPLGTLATAATSCGSVALAANTKYLFRYSATNCSVGSVNVYMNIAAKVTTP